MTGLEALTELDSLDLSNNDIIDIAGLENLTNLASLDLTGNDGILCTDLDDLELALGTGVVTRPATCNTGSLLQDGQVQSLHNAQGQRVVKSVGGSTAAVIHFIYDQAGRVLAEIDAETGSTLREYIYVNGIQVALVDDTGTPEEATYFVHNDHLGTPQKITDDSQVVTWAASYDPFGEVTETVAVIENNIRFPGQYEDAETGLHYNYFRDYDPSLGRYIESDPIGLRGGKNTYLYANANAQRYYDFLGMIAQCDDDDEKCKLDCFQKYYGPELDFANDLNPLNFGLSSGLSIAANEIGEDAADRAHRRALSELNSGKPGPANRKFGLVKVFSRVNLAAGLASALAFGFSTGANIYCTIECSGQ